MRLVFVLVTTLALHGIAGAACPPAGGTRSQLLELRTAKWEVADNARRQSLALGMLDCLADPDPVLRDEIAFEALSTWLRAGKLDAVTVDAIRTRELAVLANSDGDSAGFAQPFAALVLAEVARIDRIKPILGDPQRAELVRAGTRYLSSVRDYRGFDEKQGWRHGVAHASDLMMQLALNPALGKTAQQQILAAVAAQLSAAGAQSPAVFFHYGEGERLMRPVFYLARRGELDAPDWAAWCAGLVPPAAERAAITQASLARRHNLQGFLMPLYVSLNESKDVAQRERLLPAVKKALEQLD